MKLTREQFDEIGPWYFNDLPFRHMNDDQDKMLEVFNILPNHLQGLAIQWGCSDSVFRDDVFEYLVEKQFGMTTKEFYDKEMWKAEGLTFDFSKHGKD